MTPKLIFRSFFYLHLYLYMKINQLIISYLSISYKNNCLNIFFIFKCAISLRYKNLIFIKKMGMFDNNQPNKMIVNPSIEIKNNQEKQKIDNKQLGAYNAIQPSLLDSTFLESSGTVQMRVVAAASGGLPAALIIGGSPALRQYVASLLTGNTIIDETATAGSQLHQIYTFIQSSILSLSIEAQIRVTGSVNTPIIQATAYFTKGPSGVIEQPCPSDIPGSNLNLTNQAVQDNQVISNDRCVVLVLKDGTYNVQLIPARFAKPL